MKSCKQHGALHNSNSIHQDERLHGKNECAYTCLLQFAFYLEYEKSMSRSAVRLLARNKIKTY